MSDTRPEEEYALLARIDALRAELRLAREEIRLREESQIPVIPRGAQAQLNMLATDRARYRKALIRLREPGLSEAWIAEIIRLALEDE